jgi:putative sigma-54 modulation protein
MMTISVKSIHFHADAKLIGFIEKRLQRLTKFFDQDIRAEVHLKLQDTGATVKQKITEVHLHIPGGAWLFDKKSDLSFEGAIIASSDTLKRQLLRYKERKA